MAIRIPALEYIIDTLSFLDNPGTYIMMFVFGMVLLPFYIKGINNHMKHPEEHYEHSFSFEVKLFAGIALILFLIISGLYNLARFLH